MPVDQYGNYVPLDNEIPLKQKYRMRKTKGRYSGGERAAPRKNRNKTGQKSYVYGSWMMHMRPTGKTVMVKVI